MHEGLWWQMNVCQKHRDFRKLTTSKPVSLLNTDTCMPDAMATRNAMLMTVGMIGK